MLIALHCLSFSSLGVCSGRGLIYIQVKGKKVVIASGARARC